VVSVADPGWYRPGFGWLSFHFYDTVHIYITVLRTFLWS
jgi:hypothetical protein